VKSLRWRVAWWFSISLLGVLGVFMTATYFHLRNELRLEKWERDHPDHADWTLHGSYSEAEVDDIAGELAKLALLYSAPVAALAFGLGFYLTRRTLRPVAEMNRQLREIGANTLAQRVRLTGADEEFRVIEENVNALLARLDESFRQLNDFSARVAHELRTPLTLLRLQVEEAAAGGIDPALAESLQDELRRLSAYVDQCLLLATAEQGRLALALRPVALRALVGEMIEVYELLAREEGRTLRIFAPAEFEVRADPDKLRQILHNLFTNGLRHGRGDITVTLAREGAERICRVENDVAEGGAPTGSGTRLGLRLVRALAAAHPCLGFYAGRMGGRYVAELRWS
jgi:signal transduction histidine kinase